MHFKKLLVKCWWNRYLGLISPTFYEHTDPKKHCLFALSWTSRVGCSWNDGKIDTLSPTLIPALCAAPPGEIHKTLAHSCCCCCNWGSAGICCPTTLRPKPYGSWSSIRKRLIWLVLVGPENDPCRLVSPVWNRWTKKNRFMSST